MVFRLYDVPSGGTPLWEETWAETDAVLVTDGLFNVLLGSLSPGLPSAIQDQDQLYLGVTVGIDGEMLPRLQVGSVPLAIQATTLINKPTLSWTDLGFYTFDATGGGGERLVIDTGIDVTVPAGEIQRYLILYSGIYQYKSYERFGTYEYFYGNWEARIKDGDAYLSDYGCILIIGYQVNWNMLGGNVYFTNLIRILGLSKLVVEPIAWILL
jgi:hypothetical protein